MLHPTAAPPLALPPIAPPTPKTSDPAHSHPLLCEVITAAIAAEGGTTAEALGPSRKRAPTRSRQAAMWLAFKITPHSLQTIGDAFGRHHSTVIYGIRAYERHLAEDARARARSEHLLNRFTADDGSTEGAHS